MFSSDPAKGRVEPMWYFLVSESGDTRSWISSYLTEHKESRIIVPFVASELVDAASKKWFVRNRLHNHLLTLDRFKYTLPLREDTYFFGRKQELGQLLDFVKRSENIGIFGLRKTGKTSTILKIKRLLEGEERHALVFIDAQSPGVRKRRWNELLRYLSDQFLSLIGISSVGDFDELDATEHFGESVQKFLSSEKWSRLTIAFDEIEWLTPGTARDPHWNDEYLDFWQAIRTVQTSTSNFCIVVAGVNPSLVEMSRVGDHQNPLFGIVTPIFLRGLHPDETAELVRKI